MTIVDANVLVYAINADDPTHPAARRWLERALNGTETLGFAWLALLAFLRIATSPRALPAPMTIEEATGALEEWLARPPSVVVSPTPRHLAILRGLLGPAGTAGNLVADAHLAALAVEHGAAVASFDRDFLRFPGVRLAVPD